METPYELVKRKKARALAKIMERGYRDKKRVYIGMATCEIAAGSREVMEVFKDAGIRSVYISQKGCAGRCNLEPTVEVIEEGKKPVKYVKVTPEKAKVIIEKHLQKGVEIKEWTLDE